MKNQTKPRLSDVAKQNTTDRTSKLVSGFMPSPPPVKPKEPEPEVTTQVEDQSATELTVATNKPVITQTTPAATPKADRSKKGPTATGFAGMITQPLPPGLKCDRPIMLAGAQHQMLRELSFVHNKPMTEILYNLLEGATLPYRREQQKDV